MILIHFDHVLMIYFSSKPFFMMFVLTHLQQDVKPPQVWPANPGRDGGQCKLQAMHNIHVYVYVYACINGWMDVCMNGWMDACVDGCMDG